MDKDDAAPAEAEVVFIMHLRAGAGGWWGIVRRLDGAPQRFILSTHELYQLLDRDLGLLRWRPAPAAENPAHPPPHAAE